jgi:sortase A
MTEPVARSPWRWLDYTLVAIGVWCLAWVGLGSLQAASFRRQLEQSAPPPEAEAAAAIAGPSRPALIGRLEIPRLAVSHLIAEGEDGAILGATIGHLSDTPFPWDPGNSALAGHRDGVFRPLKDILIGDTLRLVTYRGDFDYRVTETLVVNPEEIWVLAPTASRTLTLVTCYPFSYLGAAPKRFVVRAVSD